MSASGYRKIPIFPHVVTMSVGASMMSARNRFLLYVLFLGTPRFPRHVGLSRCEHASDATSARLKPFALATGRNASAESATAVAGASRVTRAVASTTPPTSGTTVALRSLTAGGRRSIDTIAYVLLHASELVGSKEDGSAGCPFGVGARNGRFGAEYHDGAVGMVECSTTVGFCGLS